MCEKEIISSKKKSSQNTQNRTIWKPHVWRPQRIVQNVHILFVLIYISGHNDIALAQREQRHFYQRVFDDCVYSFENCSIFIDWFVSLFLLEPDSCPFNSHTNNSVRIHCVDHDFDQQILTRYSIKCFHCFSFEFEMLSQFHEKFFRKSLFIYQKVELIALQFGILKINGLQLLLTNE